MVSRSGFRKREDKNKSGRSGSADRTDRDHGFQSGVGFSIVHDVNGNRNLDKNLLGIPTEPFGFSGNKSIFRGLPSFEEAAFEVDGNEVVSSIRLIKLF